MPSSEIVYDERVSLLRKSTGFFLITMFITLFSFSFLGTIKELENVQSFDEVLKNSVHAEDFQLPTVSFMYDTNGEVISEIYSAEKRLYLSYSQIPDLFLKAIIATEDRSFFTHKGFDMNGIVRALFVNSEKNRIEQGGSTITQQLIKNIYLNNERTYNRKLTEVLYAYQLEKLFSKEKILEVYMNAIYFQNGVYGIEAASQFYFSKPASYLSLAEVAFLCAIPNNPKLYNPFHHLDNTLQRKEWILSKMLEMDYISLDEFNEAQQQSIVLMPSKKIDLFPDYVTYIHYELEQLIGEKEGINERLANASSLSEKNQLLAERKNRVEAVLASGIHIYTALEKEKQNAIHIAVEAHLPQSNIQGAAVVIDHTNNKLVAISGGKNFAKFDFHRGFQAYRQPGSAIKPLLVYGPYMAEKNISSSKRISAASFCKNGYCPQNFGGATYGNVTIETAFKHSFNTPAVRLLDELSVEKGFHYFRQFGFSKLSDEDYRLPAALGGLTYGVNLLEMTNAYTVFGNDGLFKKARGIEKVVNKQGEILYQWQEEPTQLWSKDVNDNMRRILNKVVTEGTARRAYFHSPYVGGKTGTTNDFFDLWFIGLNETYTTGVWIGEDLPKSLAEINSRVPHLLIWRDVMQ